MEISPIVLYEILQVFVDILTADCKYPVQYCGNLPLTIQMQLSEKGKAFSRIFVPFMEFASSFKHFLKKMIVTANGFRKLHTVKYFVRPLCKKRCFGTRFEIQHV